MSSWEQPTPVERAGSRLCSGALGVLCWGGDIRPHLTLDSSVPACWPCGRGADKQHGGALEGRRDWEQQQQRAATP